MLNLIKWLALNLILDGSNVRHPPYLMVRHINDILTLLDVYYVDHIFRENN